MKGMKKIVIVILIVMLGLLLSLKKPLNVVTSTSAQITKQNIGLPSDAVKRLRNILTP